MAKYNILDEDDIFSESGDDKKKESQDLSQGDPEIKIDGDDLFDDSLLVEDNAADPDETDLTGSATDDGIDLELNEESGSDGSEEKLKDFFRDDAPELADEAEQPENLPEEPTPAELEEVDEPEELQEPEPPPVTEQDSQSQVKQIIDDYEDDKIQGMNLKPFIIGGVIIVLLVAAYFIIDMFLLGDGSKEAEIVQPVETQVPAEPQLSAEEIRKNQKLAQIAGQSERELNLASNVASLGAQNAKFSSMLLYDKTFMVEFFGKDRADVAKVHRAMQANLPKRKIEILASNTRTGDSGGIFSLYSLEMNGGSGSKDVSQKFANANEAINWMKNISKSAGTKVEMIEKRSDRSKDGFQVSEIEARFSGSLDNCKAFLAQIAGSSSNLKIYKLNLTAVDQQTFNTSRFQLKMVVQVYV